MFRLLKFLQHMPCLEKEWLFIRKGFLILGLQPLQSLWVSFLLLFGRKVGSTLLQSAVHMPLVCYKFFLQQRRMLSGAGISAE
ncbi:hypothetical protein AA3271_2476 [Gluconobacter japonicus NBRC 3271]|nr:hypothetical protein AA3271_2476 [Gluconobacter japonicus NBRC 3271]